MRLRAYRSNIYLIINALNKYNCVKYNFKLIKIEHNYILINQIFSMAYYEHNLKRVF